MNQNSMDSVWSCNADHQILKASGSAFFKNMTTVEAINAGHIDYPDIGSGDDDDDDVYTSDEDSDAEVVIDKTGICKPSSEREQVIGGSPITSDPQRLDKKGKKSPHRKKTSRKVDDPSSMESASGSKKKKTKKKSKRRNKANEEDTTEENGGSMLPTKTEPVSTAHDLLNLQQQNQTTIDSFHQNKDNERWSLTADIQILKTSGPAFFHNMNTVEAMKSDGQVVSDGEDDEDLYTSDRDDQPRLVSPQQLAETDPYHPSNKGSKKLLNPKKSTKNIDNDNGPLESPSSSASIRKKKKKKKSGSSPTRGSGSSTKSSKNKTKKKKPTANATQEPHEYKSYDQIDKLFAQFDKPKDDAAAKPKKSLAEMLQSSHIPTKGSKPKKSLVEMLQCNQTKVPAKGSGLAATSRISINSFKSNFFKDKLYLSVEDVNCMKLPQGQAIGTNDRATSLPARQEQSPPLSETVEEPKEEESPTISEAVDIKRIKAQNVTKIRALAVMLDRIHQQKQYLDSFHQEKGDDAVSNKSLSTKDRTQQSYAELVTELELYENLLEMERTEISKQKISMQLKQEAIEQLFRFEEQKNRGLEQKVQQLEQQLASTSTTSTSTQVQDLKAENERLEHLVGILQQKNEKQRESIVSMRTSATSEMTRSSGPSLGSYLDDGSMMLSDYGLPEVEEQSAGYQSMSSMPGKVQGELLQLRSSLKTKTVTIDEQAQELAQVKQELAALQGERGVSNLTKHVQHLEEEKKYFVAVIESLQSKLDAAQAQLQDGYRASSRISNGSVAKAHTDISLSQRMQRLSGILADL